MKRILPASNIDEKKFCYLTTNERLIIPFFQRGYSWGEKEISELFDDLILDYSEGNGEYLLGNIVLLTFDRDELLILDGQQRLTTMMLIIKELAKYVTKYPLLKEILNEIIYQTSREGDIIFDDFKLQRKDQDGNLSNIVVPDEVLSFIERMVKEKFVNMENFEEKGGIVDYLIDTVFITQTYVATDSVNKQNETIVNILKYFVKFNTRGKRFDDSENADAIKLLQEIK